MYDEDPRDSEQDYYKRGEYDALRSPLVTALLEAVAQVLEAKIYVDAEQNALLIALEAAAEALRIAQEQP